MLRFSCCVLSLLQKNKECQGVSGDGDNIIAKRTIDHNLQNVTLTTRGFEVEGTYLPRYWTGVVRDNTPWCLSIITTYYVPRYLPIHKYLSNTFQPGSSKVSNSEGLWNFLEASKPASQGEQLGPACPRGITLRTYT